MDNYVGYAQLDFLLTKFIEENSNIDALEWGLVPEEKLKRITVPSKDFNEKVVEAYSVLTGAHKVNDVEADLFYVFGKYIRKDFYSKNKFDKKTDYFYTLYVSKRGTGDSFVPAKYAINQREYKSWLIDMLEKGERYKTSLEVKERSTKIQQIFLKAADFCSINSRPDATDEDDTDLKGLF